MTSHDVGSQKDLISQVSSSNTSQKDVATQKELISQASSVKDLIYELYTCDFCLKHFPENHLEQCDNCGEIFCPRCVPEKILAACKKYTRAKHYFCSRVCRVELDVCYVEKCNNHHTVRGYTPYLSSEVRRDAASQSVWRWRSSTDES